MQISTLRPGLLVSLNTRLEGNVSYSRRDIEPDHFEGDGTRRAKWETDRVIADAAEYEEGTKIRSKARSLITSVCTPSAFGLLCPEKDREKLDDAIRQARDVIGGFNGRARITQAGVYVMIGRIAQDDVEAVRSINSEIRGLLSEMEFGLKKLDVDAVRAAASKAKELTAMLSADAGERVAKAVALARSAARRIVKAGETAAIEIDQATLDRVRETRAAFLDLEDAPEVLEPEQTGRAIDLDLSDDAEDDMPPAAPPAPTVSLEFGEF